MGRFFQKNENQARSYSLWEQRIPSLRNPMMTRAPHPKLVSLRFALRSSKGLTLVELIATVTIISILAMGALPLAKISIKRQKELELRRALREMREAIDRYKDAADRGFIEVKLGTDGYPPDLETLVKGVTQVNATDKKLRFLRRIPIDPMTGKPEWAMRSSQDSPDSTSFGGQNVYDVYSKSPGTALDESKYSDW
jgi:general secretion pathway protein G